MRYDTDFHRMITEGYVLVSVNVLYHLPDTPSLLNEFSWTTLDLKPKYPRIQKFLSFWEREIEGRIKEVIISDSPYLETGRWRNGIIFPT